MMLKFATLAMVGALSAAAAAQAVMMLSHSGSAPLRNPQAAMAAAPADGGAADAASGQAAEIAKSEDGHYWAEGDVNGTRVRFLVDTGATAVALTAEDAERLGFDPAHLNFAYNISTANGQQRAAQVRLASLSVAGARVDDVDALVIEKGLPSSLLGMSYLGRLSKFEATRSSLILQP
jgi:aspartyl protease family protein